VSGSRWVAIGAGLGALAVTAGAFGAHGLEGRLSAEQLATYEIAARYQMYHALAIVAAGLWVDRYPSRWATVAAGCFLLGVVVFCGLLYALVFTGVRVLGAIVPIGGLAFIVGWLALAADAATRAAQHR
jgi:uncharacterized membrane protein YgdD (TMEM256/DUF423 family)